jgi:hypothetical protein
LIARTLAVLVLLSSTCVAAKAAQEEQESPYPHCAEVKAANFGA